MTLREFALAQQEDGRRALSSLLENCIRRYLLAASLVEVSGPIIERIRDAKYSGNIDLAPLFPAWNVICERYRGERFNPQATLFKEHGANELERWGQYLHWHLFPTLLRENEFVRNVLRVTGLLPCNSVNDSAFTLCHHVREMHLPNERPVTDHGEIES
jgi:hypothetical protein